jgi:formylglycine-generating enzyme required for sulfatase activity
MPRDFETPQILHDAPLRHDDQHHFHFDEFAVTLCRLIADKHTRTPLTIGVSGSWGSGKTTLLQRTKKMLDEQFDPKSGRHYFANEQEVTEKIFRPCKTVWFDAWKYSNEDHLLAALIRRILATMASGGLGDKFWSKVLDKSYPRRDVIATFLSFFSFKVDDTGVEFDINKFKTETPFAQNTAFFDFFDDALNELLARWVHDTGDPKKIDESSGALVIFIDDLDRCLPEKTVQVLEAIKLFLDKHGCLFVLGADTRIVQDAVASHYKDTGITGESAGDYLEKVIQLRFELPPILTEQMGDYLRDDETAKQMVDDQVRQHWSALVTGADINPRRVKKVVNDVNLQWAMLKNTGQAKGVNRDDFTRWQILMLVAPGNFVKRLRDFDSIDEQFQFVIDAIRWSRDKSTAAETYDSHLLETYKEFATSVRLRRTLRELSFSQDFNAQILNAYLHLAAPQSEAVKSTLDLMSEIRANWWGVALNAFDNDRLKVQVFVSQMVSDWLVLEEAGGAGDVKPSDFIQWNILLHVAPSNFVKRLYDIDDVELRYKFILDALKWGGGDTDLDATFQDYARSLRLRRVLREIKAFSDQFTPIELDAFLHLTTVPTPPLPTPVDTGPDVVLPEAIELKEEAFATDLIEARVATHGEAKAPTSNVQTWGGVEFVRIPAGKFVMGSKDDNQLASDAEKPQHSVEIPYDYWLTRYPVTNEQFARFVEKAAYKFSLEENWKKKADHPVVNVSWQDAMAYCKWLNTFIAKDLNLSVGDRSEGIPMPSLAGQGDAHPAEFLVRLPSEAEWEKAARGKYGNEWPWGNEFDENKCNSSEGSKGGTTPVGSYSPQGDSPYGVADMAGNVWEWCHSLSKSYPYIVNDGREDESAPETGARVLRGGSFHNFQGSTRCASRDYRSPDFWRVSYGFRVAISPGF